MTQPRTILAIAVGASSFSVALLHDGKALLRESNAPLDAAESVLVITSSLLDDHALTRHDLQAIAFAAGPGAFTGLRVACGIAQGLGWALDLPVVPVDSLATVAWQMSRRAGDRLLVVQDARMGEIYAAVYESLADASLLTLRPPWVGSLQTLGPALAQYPELCGAGDAFRVHQQGLEALAKNLRRCNPELASRADAVAYLAQQMLVDPLDWPAAQAAPFYVRDKVALNVREQAELRLEKDRQRVSRKGPMQ